MRSFPIGGSELSKPVPPFRLKGLVACGKKELLKAIGLTTTPAVFKAEKWVVVPEVG